MIMFEGKELAIDTFTCQVETDSKGVMLTTSEVFENLDNGIDMPVCGSEQFEVWLDENSVHTATLGLRCCKCQEVFELTIWFNIDWTDIEHIELSRETPNAITGGWKVDFTGTIGEAIWVQRDKTKMVNHPTIDQLAIFTLRGENYPVVVKSWSEMGMVQCIPLITDKDFGGYPYQVGDLAIFMTIPVNVWDLLEYRGFLAMDYEKIKEAWKDFLVSEDAPPSDATRNRCNLVRDQKYHAWIPL